MVCNFWRWSKIWKPPFSRQKGSSGSVWALFSLGYKEHGQCRHTVQNCQTGLLGTGSSVDTAWDCVDTLSRPVDWVHWELGLASTLLDLVSTPLDLFFINLP
ncbi:hypothetical protein Taro_015256 [Colocasia esculenta]|uniref:Uncharacterized protein n=1 Tax=Colocasia esculenta TaxID=4460 RepID=A0A843ULU7_COLES|nr:hypothetical protein [Colocasia esculenta]